MSTCKRCGKPTADRHEFYDRAGRGPAKGTLGHIVVHTGTGLVTCRQGTRDRRSPRRSPLETPESSGTEQSVPSDPSESPLGRPISPEPAPTPPEPPLSHVPPKVEGTQGTDPSQPHDSADSRGDTTGDTQGTCPLIEDYFT